MMFGRTEPLLRIPDVESAVHNPVGWQGESLMIDERFHLVPDAHLLISIPQSGNRLVLHKIDLDAALEKSGVSGIHVVSRPPSYTVLGDEFVYEVHARGTKGGFRYRLGWGPPGMTVSPKGVVSWKVPANFDENQASVLVTVSDAQDKEAFHLFDVAVVKERPAEPNLPVVAKVDPKPDPPAVAKGIVPEIPPPESNIKPAPLKSDRDEVRLTSNVTDACIGGGGRFYILSLAYEAKVAIFDVNSARIVKYLDVGHDVRIAASMDKLFVVSAGKKMIRRFSLDTFKEETNIPFPVANMTTGIATGHAASGLLALYPIERRAAEETPLLFIDPVSFQVVSRVEAIDLTDRPVHYRASPDNTTFGAWSSRSNQSLVSVILAGKTPVVSNGDKAGGVLPAADNTLITGAGLFSPECKPLAGDNAKPQFRFRMPATSGPFYVTCPGGSSAPINTGNELGKPVTVHYQGDARPIAVLKNLILPVGSETYIRDDYTQDKRVLFVPEGKLIAIIPRTDDRLILYRFDPNAALEKSPIDYLFVSSRPPFQAKKGMPYAYRIVVRSKKGGVTYRLTSGPDGMQIGEAGVVHWNVPVDFANAEIGVVVNIGDASGRDLFHTFRIAIGG
jgi:hypothetical protein